MEIKNLSNVRRLALAAVLFNVVAILFAAIALPSELKALVPVLGLVLPMLTLSVIGGAAERRLGAHFAA
jgi:hypothetical protein